MAASDSFGCFLTIHADSNTINAVWSLSGNFHSFAEFWLVNIRVSCHWLGTQDCLSQIFTATKYRHSVIFLFLAIKGSSRLLIGWNRSRDPHPGLWLAPDDLIKISENHSQLLRPSYTPKSHDYGIDRVSEELSSRELQFSWFKWNQCGM